MQKQKLDLSAFEKAIAQLEQSLVYYHSPIVQQDPGLVLQLRAAAIQAFEFTYELAYKTMKRYLSLVNPNPAAVDQISFPDLIRSASDYGLLQNDLSVWKDYRHQRGATSHTYDQEKAEEVFAEIPDFLKESKYLLASLKERSQNL